MTTQESSRSPLGASAQKSSVRHDSTMYIQKMPHRTQNFFVSEPGQLQSLIQRKNLALKRELLMI